MPIREELIAQFNKITPEDMPSPQDRIQALTNILSEISQRSELLFTPEEVANMYYNRALDYFTWGDELLDDGDAKNANRYGWYHAASDIRNAWIGYDRSFKTTHDQRFEDYKRSCDKQLEVFRKLHNRCVRVLEAERKTSTSTFFHQNSNENYISDATTSGDEISVGSTGAVCSSSASSVIFSNM